MTKKRARLTSSAPATTRNSVKGNGGGSRSSAASVSAPLDATRRLIRSSFRSGTSDSSPGSPALLPTQKDVAAPATDPAVATMGYSQNSDG